MQRSIKVLWAAFLVSIYGAVSMTSVKAQPPEPVRSSDVPVISAEELLRLLGDKPPITVKFKDASLKQVLDELSQQTGLAFRILDMGRPKDKEEKPVTVDVGGKELWPVLDELSRQMAVNFQPDHAGSGFQVWPGGGMINPERGNGPQSKTPLGAMRIDMVGHSRTLRWSADGNAKTDGSLSLGLRIRIDPRIRVLASSSQLKIDEATDNAGRSLAPTRPPMTAGLEMNGTSFDDGSGRQFSTSLRALVPPAQSLARLKGSVRLRVTTRSETWEADVDEDKPRTKTIQRDGTEVLLSAGTWRRSGGNFEIELAMREVQPPLNAALANRRRSLSFSTFGNVRLLDAQNRELSRGGGSGNGSGTGLEYKMSFSSRGGENDAGEPAKLVWTIPVEWKEIDLPFEFRDIPLP